MSRPDELRVPPAVRVALLHSPQQGTLKHIMPGFDRWLLVFCRSARLCAKVALPLCRGELQRALCRFFPPEKVPDSHLPPGITSQRSVTTTGSLTQVLRVTELWNLKDTLPPSPFSLQPGCHRQEGSQGALNAWDPPWSLCELAGTGPRSLGFAFELLIFLLPVRGGWDRFQNSII